MVHEESACHVLTMANEDYLETIYRIVLEQGDVNDVRSVDIAERLRVSKASVSKALTTLKDQGYVEQSRYGKVNLTAAGMEYAELLWNCHRMIRAFLVKDLGVDEHTADKEACLMEHAISRDTMAKWMKFLEEDGFRIEDE